MEDQEDRPVVLGVELFLDVGLVLAEELRAELHVTSCVNCTTSMMA